MRLCGNSDRNFKITLYGTPLYNNNNNVEMSPTTWASVLIKQIHWVNTN